MFSSETRKTVRAGFDPTSSPQRWTRLATELSTNPSAATMSSSVLRLSDAEKEMAEWISYLVVKNRPPISVVDCPAMRKLARLKPVSSKSVRKHVLSLMTVVKEYVKQHLPSTYALVFEGWTEGTDHYIGIWASYNVTDGTHDGKEHPIQTLLSICLLLVADGIEGMTARDHLSHIKRRILDGYGKKQNECDLPRW